MTLQKQIKHINNSLFAAKMANLIQYMYEDELKQAVAAIFKHMREEITANLEEFYGDVLFNAHMDLILAPIHENHKKYYDTIMKYKLREHRKGRTQGKRLVERAQKYAIQYSKKYTGAIKADDKIPLSSLVQKDKLFATSDFSAEQMRDKTFVASENTLARVDKDINGIITDGYREGLGINDVTNRVNTRFNQLETWEAQRIARTEIHNSHMQGVMNSYEDMGVEYTQWAAAHDNRTRDTHSAIDGEIIPWGGVFSNGLRYPGDTSGPISEWINCRCGVLPWFCPPGMMVPVGMSNFRESDLIVTLDKWSNEQLLTQFREEVSPIPKQSSSFDLDIVNPKLIDSKFSIPNEDLSEFGITEKGMETIQRYTKRRIGSDIEYGVVFNEKNGKFLSKEFKGASNDIVLTKPNGKYSTIHYHTDEGFRPTSSGDFFEFLNSKNERVGINISRKESWFIKNEGKLTSKEINKITVDIDRLEQKQLKKLTDEYRKSSLKINKIKDPVKRQSAQKEFEKYVANEFLDKHNKELGDAILEYTSNIKGLKVKRVMHTEINPKSIKTISKKELKVDKRSFEELTGVKRHSTPINNKDYNKYALTSVEEKTLAQLEAEKDSLGMIEKRSYKELADRKEFNSLWNKILREGGNPTDVMELSGGEGVRYEKLMKKFKDWTPKGDIEIKPIQINKKTIFKDKDAFKLTSEEKQAYKKLKKNKGSLSKDEKEYYSQLSTKLQLHQKHQELIGSGLSETKSKTYVNLYSKYQKQWNLPELPLDLKFTTQQKSFISYDYYKNATEFKLTKKEADKLYELEKKQLYGQKLTSNELKTIDELHNQQRFIYLNNINQTEKGLDYDATIEFKKLYKSLKTKLKLDKSVLEQPLTGYESKISLDKNPKNLKTFKGTNDDGLLPNGESLEKYFTKDAREMTIREQKVADRWLGSDYKAFTNFEVDCGRDVKKFEKWIEQQAKAYLKNPSENLYNEYYYHAVYDRTSGKFIDGAAKRLAESIAHDVPVLDDILNNQLKEGMTLWRVQENHNLESTAVGDIMDFPNFRSTAISKKGALWFSKTNAKEMKYLIEIEAPAGTKGAYLAPIKQGEITNPTSPFVGEKYANEMEFLLKKSKVEVVKFEDKTVKGANGEKLKHILLRIVG